MKVAPSILAFNAHASGSSCTAKILINRIDVYQVQYHLFAINIKRGRSWRFQLLAALLISMIMKHSKFLFALSTLLIAKALSARIPGADTPLFYLVASSSSPATNLAPLRLDTTLTGTTPIVQFYFNSQGFLSLIDPTTGANYNAIVNSGFNGDDCSSDGALVFVQGSSSNKCSRSQGFEIQSDSEDSQLGSQLVFNFVGAFYACGDSEAVWYKVNEADAPSGCSPVSLYTLPVVAC